MPNWPHMNAGSDLLSQNALQYQKISGEFCEVCPGNWLGTVERRRIFPRANSVATALCRRVRVERSLWRLHNALAYSGGTVAAATPRRVGSNRGYAAKLFAPLAIHICHRSELSTASLRPDWHFREKPIHPKARNSRVTSRVPVLLLFNLLTLLLFHLSLKEASAVGRESAAASASLLA